MFSVVKSKAISGILSQLAEPNNRTPGLSQPGAGSPVLPRQKQLKKIF